MAGDHFEVIACTLVWPESDSMRGHGFTRPDARAEKDIPLIPLIPLPGRLGPPVWTLLGDLLPREDQDYLENPCRLRLLSALTSRSRSLS